MSGIPSWAVPGAKVVCVVEGERWTADGCDMPAELPQLGMVYTVARLRAHTNGLHLDLIEVATTKSFHINGFRPVVADDTEAELFRKRHIPSKTSVPV